jgi:SGNH hydrolase-like domain, acetyltransferase AlgX
VLQSHVYQKVLLGLGLITVATVAFAQGNKPCAAFFDGRNVYYGPDDQIVADWYFETVPVLPFTETIPYLKRLSGALRSRGIVPVIAMPPPEGLAFVNRLDPATIKGTLFEKLSQPTYKPGVLAAYREGLKPFATAGFETPDLGQGLADDVLTHPKEVYYFKHDWHWQPPAAKASAYALQKYLAKKFPELTREIRSKDFKVSIKETVPRSSMGGWDRVIRRKCPDGFQAFTENRPVVEVQQPDQSGNDLFGDQKVDVALVGTSYSAGPHGPAFVPYLSEALGTEVLNAGFDGGGMLGAMQEWLISSDAGQTPRVLVWEFPRIILAERSESNPLTAVMLRQILPLLAKAPKPGKRLSVPLQTVSVLDFSVAKSTNQPVTKTDFIRIQFDSFQTRDFKLKLVFDSGSEEVEMVRTHGTHLDSFALELPGARVLKQVIVEVLEAPQGNVSVESFKY